MTIYIDFGKLLRQARRKAGLTQEVLADRVGLTRTSITNIEAGRQPVNLELLYRFAAAVQSDAADLLPAQKAQKGEAPHASSGAGSRLPHLAPASKSWIDKVLETAKSEGSKS
jgi:transcriptional regulator with XRE-family HTH domain